MCKSFQTHVHSLHRVKERHDPTTLSLYGPTNLTFHAIFAVTALIAAFTQVERYHKMLVIFVSACFVLYIVLAVCPDGIIPKTSAMSATVHMMP